MNKIIVALDPLRYNWPTATYAVGLARENCAHLVGVFLEDFTYHSYNAYDLVGSEGFNAVDEDIFEQKDLEVRQKAVKSFTDICTRQEIKYSVHHDRNIAIRELIHESVYADLLIVSSEETIIHYAENPPTTFIRSLLAEAKCPVHVVPAPPVTPASIVFLYDGSPCSVEAIRSFCHVFHSSLSLPLNVVTVNEPAQHSGKRLLGEMLAAHFSNVRYTSLVGHPKTEITNYLKNHEKAALVVLGAYSRGTLSRWFKRSMADALMEELRVPLFIAHN
jgi:nucleotide-binding universal stress UspA family protein